MRRSSTSRSGSRRHSTSSAKPAACSSSSWHPRTPATMPGSSSSWDDCRAGSGLRSSSGIPAGQPMRSSAFWRAHQAAYCVMSGAGLPCILRATATFVYLRRHGPDTGSLYAGSYSDDDLRWWAGRIREWDASGRDVFAYFTTTATGTRCATHTRCATWSPPPVDPADANGVLRAGDSCWVHGQV